MSRSCFVVDDVVEMKDLNFFVEDIGASIAKWMLDFNPFPGAFLVRPALPRKACAVPILRRRSYNLVNHT